jgi:hypothetical protein
VVMRKIVERMVQLSASHALERWREAVEELRTMAFKGNKVVMRWKLQTVSMTLEVWNTHVQQELRKRQIMARMVLRHVAAKCILRS